MLVGGGRNMEVQGQLCSEVTISTDFTSSEILCYRPFLRPFYSHLATNEKYHIMEKKNTISGRIHQSLAHDSVSHFIIGQLMSRLI